MTVLTLSAAGCNCAASFIETSLPVHEPEAAQRVADGFRECAENYGRTRVHIELEPIEGEETPALHLVKPAGKPSDLTLVLELAERFLSEGEPLPGLKQIAAVAAIDRLKGN